MKTFRGASGRSTHRTRIPCRLLCSQPSATRALRRPLPSRGGHSSMGALRTFLYLPAILQPSLWRSLIPRFLRRSSRENGDKPEKKKGWNPATYFIWMALLIGSQSINLLALQNDFTHFTLETDAKLERLREVVKRIQNGEDVDVEAMLGTGDAKKEKEWEEVMRELEAEDAVFRARRKRLKGDTTRDKPQEEPSQTEPKAE